MPLVPEFEEEGRALLQEINAMMLDVVAVVAEEQAAAAAGGGGGTEELDARLLAIVVAAKHAGLQKLRQLLDRVASCLGDSAAAEGLVCTLLHQWREETVPGLEEQTPGSSVALCTFMAWNQVRQACSREAWGQVADTWVFVSVRLPPLPAPAPVSAPRPTRTPRTAAAPWAGAVSGTPSSA